MCKQLLQLITLVLLLCALCACTKVNNGPAQAEAAIHKLPISATVSTSKLPQQHITIHQVFSPASVSKDYIEGLYEWFSLFLGYNFILAVIACVSYKLSQFMAISKTVCKNIYFY